MQVGRSWTFLYYMNGDNNLREEVSLDFVRLHQAGAPEDTAVVAQLHRGEERWALSNLQHKLARLGQKQLPCAFAEDWRGARTFVVGHEPQSSRAVDAPSGKPADPAGLEEFLTWGVREYPADHYAIVLDGHGEGANGLLRDGDGQKIGVEQLREILQRVQTRSGGKLSLLTLQACSMGHPAVSAALSSAVPLIVASPEKIPAARARHDLLMRRLEEQADKSPEAVARTVAGTLAETLPGMKLLSERDPR